MCGPTSSRRSSGTPRCDGGGVRGGHPGLDWTTTPSHDLPPACTDLLSFVYHNQTVY